MWAEWEEWEEITGGTRNGKVKKVEGKVDGRRGVCAKEARVGVGKERA